VAWDDTPQSARGWLYLLKPSVVFKAQINMTATYPADEITFDNVDGAFGAYTDIKIGQTVMIGSSPGEYDLGRTYVRAAATSTTLPIGRSSRGKMPGEVVLTDNAYVTVLDLYEVWFKPGYIDLVTAEIYKDADLPGNTPPTPIMCVGDLGGVGRIDFATAGALVIDLFDYAGSDLILSTESWVSREWDFGDGTVLSGTTTSADPVVEFPVGYRWITLTGESDTGAISRRRYLVVVLDPDSPDVRSFENLEYERTANGMSLRANLREYLIPEEYPPGTVGMDRSCASRPATSIAVRVVVRCVPLITAFAELLSVSSHPAKRCVIVTVLPRFSRARYMHTVPGGYSSGIRYSRRFARKLMPLAVRSYSRFSKLLTSGESGSSTTTRYRRRLIAPVSLSPVSVIQRYPTGNSTTGAADVVVPLSTVPSTKSHSRLTHDSVERMRSDPA
jgi:hypothetical protein